MTFLAAPAFAIRLIKVKPVFELTGEFTKPTDVSVSKNGLIYVVDGVNNKIKVFDPKGKFFFSFGKEGSLLEAHPHTDFVMNLYIQDEQI